MKKKMCRKKDDTISREENQNVKKVENSLHFSLLSFSLHLLLPPLAAATASSPPALHCTATFCARSLGVGCVERNEKAFTRSGPAAAASSASKHLKTLIAAEPSPRPARLQSSTPMWSASNSCSRERGLKRPISSSEPRPSASSFVGP